MDIRTKGNLTSIHLDSVIDFFDQKPSQANRRHYNSIMDNRRNYQFYGCNDSGRDVIRAGLVGDERHYDIMLGYVSSLKSVDVKPYEQTIKKQKRKIEFTDFGDEVDIHKVNQGNIQTAWRKTARRKVDTNHHLVTVMIDIGGNHHVTVNESLWRAAVAYVLVDSLVKRNKSVKVIIGAASSQSLARNRGMLLTTDVIVKEYNEPLSMQRLASMCNVGFHRTYNFCARMLLEDRIQSGMGKSENILGRTPPIQMQAEIAKGNTKYLYIPRCTSYIEASVALDSVEI